LHSLQPLVSSVTAAAAAAAAAATTSRSDASTQPLTLFVGGKGGVGKTSVSAALAVQLASNDNDGAPSKRILVVSTDPAHSLGDALDVNLKSGLRIRLDEYTAVLHSPHSLYAQEIGATAALTEWKEALQALNVQRLAETLGVAPSLLESLGLNDWSSVLNNPPPGLDELVALSNIFDTNQEVPFDVIVVDTAPTGHTLRLLALPQFLSGLVTKLVAVRSKLKMLTSTVSSFLGSSGSSTGSTSTTTESQERALEMAVSKLQQFQDKLARLSALLQSPDATRFVIVTVPTVLGLAETKRLAVELQQEQKMTVSDIVVNQCVVHNDGDSTDQERLLHTYYQRRVSQQQKWVTELTKAVQKVSDSKEYQQNVGHDKSMPNAIAVTNVPYWDVELVGAPALGYVGSQVYATNPNFAHLVMASSEAASKDTAAPKVVICGGKGGVGKTTTSASLAITMAALGGHKVALISTDPAHSLGDAVDMNLSGGTLFDCSLAGVPGYTGEGSLSVLEIDPAASLQQFKNLVNQLVGGGEAMGAKGASSSSSSTDSNQGFRDTLRDLQEVFDTLPAGTDEVVALAKIVKLVKAGGFDRIVLDTAPTGHTLRMLGTPSFLADFIERILRISDKINANPLVQMFIATSPRREEIKAAIETSKSTLLSFQFQMYDLEDLFANAEQTEFLIVTVPTELAVRESIRLLNDLTFEAPDMPIKVRNVIVNQVLNNNDSDAVTFLSHLERTQTASIVELERFTSSLAGPAPRITKVPYLDTEPRGVYGLKALAAELVKQDTVPVKA
jgi:arsenite/tail-anchored protein-transporting ATPase